MVQVPAYYGCLVPCHILHIHLTHTHTYTYIVVSYIVHTYTHTTLVPPSPLPQALIWLHFCQYLHYVVFARSWMCLVTRHRPMCPYCYCYGSVAVADDDATFDRCQHSQRQSNIFYTMYICA